MNEVLEFLRKLKKKFAGGGGGVLGEGLVGGGGVRMDVM